MEYEKYEPVIGLEIHAQLNTKTKLFSRALNRFGDEPNTNIGIPDTGQPGALPIINKEAVKKAVMFGCAINADISLMSTFDRKSYFYPDSPRNFQITQFEIPIIQGGSVTVADKTFHIHEAHLEDDAGMLKHFTHFAGVDYNRAGVPLIEIVSTPCMHTPSEASSYAMAIKAILEYLDVSDCNMEEGSLRIDVNVSVRLRGETELRPRIEIKNLNSFTHVEWAIEAEVRRQVQAYETHPLIDFAEVVSPGTYRFDVVKRKTVPMRTKEGAADYRYFPEPDLPPLVLSEEMVETIRKNIPELPQDRYIRYVDTLKLTSDAANVLISDKRICDMFEEGLTMTSNARALCNWITIEFLGRTKEKNLPITHVSAKTIAELINLIDQQTITGKIAKQIADDLIENPSRTPLEIIQSNPDYTPLSDAQEIDQIIDAVLAEHPDSITLYRSGRERAFNFLVGQVMKKTQGKANPTVVRDTLKNKLQS